MVVRDDSKRSLDMDEIIEGVKTQYANIASRSREEVENWNKKKVKTEKEELNCRGKGKRKVEEKDHDLESFSEKVHTISILFAVFFFPETLKNGMFLFYFD